MSHLQQPSDYPKLFMLLLGSKAPARNVEQHDYFFGIAHTLKELVPQIKAFWPEAGNSLHIDGWRHVTNVDGHRIGVLPKAEVTEPSSKKLFFVNLGGYQSGKLEEQHYTVLCVNDDRVAAVQGSKRTEFFKKATIATVKGANSHIDEKYGIDVDDIYRIDDILAPHQKAMYHIQVISSAEPLPADEVHLGYFRLEKL